MIKYVNLATQVRDKKDFDLITKLLMALGLRSAEVEDNPEVILQPFFPSSAALEVVYRKNVTAALVSVKCGKHIFGG